MNHRLCSAAEHQQHSSQHSRTRTRHHQLLNHRGAHTFLAYSRLSLSLDVLELRVVPQNAAPAGDAQNGGVASLAVAEAVRISPNLAEISVESRRAVEPHCASF